MFTQLIDIKKIREGRLRQQLAEETRQHQENVKNLEIMIAQRQQLHQEWRQAGREGQGSLSAEALARLRRRLAGFHHQDIALGVECQSLRAAIAAWPDSQQRLQAHIRRATLEQEKLKYLAEHTD